MKLGEFDRFEAARDILASLKKDPKFFSEFDNYMAKIGITAERGHELFDKISEKPDLSMEEMIMCFNALWIGDFLRLPQDAPIYYNEDLDGLCEEYLEATPDKKALKVMALYTKWIKDRLEHYPIRDDVRVTSKKPFVDKLPPYKQEMVDKFPTHLLPELSDRVAEHLKEHIALHFAYYNR